MEDRRRNWEQRERNWKAWMTEAQAGDGAAYEKLLFELLPHARRLVARRLADRALREDVVQNVFVSIHRARHTYRADRRFGPWFHAIVRNAITDGLRSHGRRAGRELSLESEGVPEPQAPPPAVDDRALSPELERALESLPPAQREAVELIHLEGLSVAEAAEQAGVTRSALKVRAHRGYRAMRRWLEEREP